MQEPTLRQRILIVAQMIDGFRVKPMLETLRSAEDSDKPLIARFVRELYDFADEIKEEMGGELPECHAVNTTAGIRLAYGEEEYQQAMESYVPPPTE